jgi:hypothetical protein
LDDELGTLETEPAPLVKVPVKNPLIDEAIAALASVAKEDLPTTPITLQHDSPYATLPPMGACEHKNTIITAQGEVDHDRTCADCGLTWVEGREVNDGIVAPKRPAPKKAKAKAETITPVPETMPTMAETMTPDPGQSPIITPPMLEKIAEGLQKLGPQPPIESEPVRFVVKPFEPGPRADGNTIQELLDGCKAHGLNQDSVWAYAVRKGYSRPNGDGSKNWMSMSANGAGRFLALMQPEKVRGFKEYLEGHFERAVAP